MSFPISPTNGQTVTINNVVYTYNAGNNSWTGAGVTTNTSTSTKFYTSATAPIGPNVGDRWYKTTTDVMYEYVNDGAGNTYWVDIYTQQNVFNNRKFTTSATPPTGPLLGDMWYNSSSDTLFAYIQDGAGGSYWVDISTRAFGANANPVYTSVTVSNAMILPSGTLTSRANASVTAGTMRINTDTNYIEFYWSNAWVATNYIGPNYVTATTVNASTVTSGSYTIATFTSSGYFNITAVVGAPTMDVLIVAGGGAGGGVIGGGGGGGGVLYGANISPVTGNVTVVVGAGGTPGGNGFNTGAAEAGATGTNSSILYNSITYIALGGGGGGSYSALSKSGGSGGGGASTGTTTGGTSTQTSQTPLTGYGYAGGVGSDPYGGGGGGAGGIGGTSGSAGSNYGGIGLSNSITGTATYYAGGGGGGTRQSGQATAGAGGLGGGGSGIATSTYVSATQNGNTNTGGGAGGGGYVTSVGAVQVGGNGGSGIVIIKYKSS